MSAATPDRASKSTLELPDVHVLQDALYEIVTTGIDLQKSGVPVAAVEKFLHEHARQAKSRDEFVAFYKTCGLALPAPGGPWSEPSASEIRILPLPPMRAEPELRPLSLDVVRELGEDETNPHVELLEESDLIPMSQSTRAPLAVWAAVAAVATLVFGAAAWGYGTLSELRGELRAAERRGEASQRVIQQLEGRAQQLEGQAAGIESSVAATGEMINQMDQKSDLMLQWMAKPSPDKRRK